jgi:NAD(P)-dependent dehydrogenase (short-subunit alcohol dehydrogenase family)
LIADVADESSAPTAVEAAWKGLGGIDFLVHAAAPAPLTELTPEVWRRHIDVNLSGAFTSCVLAS